MFERFIKRLDAVALAPASWGAAFIGVVSIRFFFEALSSPSLSGALASDVPTLLHYALFYFVTLLSVALVLHWFAPAGARTLKFAIFALPVIWLAPILDLLISGGEGYGMAYIFRDPSRLWTSFLTFFGPFFLRGITPGIRIEVAIILVAVAFYIYGATRRAWKALAAAVLVYALLFVFLAFPSIAKLPFDAASAAARNQAVVEFWSASGAQSLLVQSFSHPSGELIFNISIARIYYILAAALCAWWCALLRRKTFIVIVKNSRPERVLYYFTMIALGMVIARHSGAWYAPLAWLDYVSLASLAIAVYSAWMFSVGVNDIHDAAIDAVSNPHRPLVTGAATARDLRQANLMFASSALIGGYLLGSYALFFIAAFLAAYYIYSAPPLRLRRVPILATFLIAVASLAAAMAGFYAVSADRAAAAFPMRIAALLVAFVTLGAIVKDVKDVEGDRREGIMTIPNSLGPSRSIEIAGILIGVAPLLVPFVLGARSLIIPSLAAALAAHALVIRKPYREWPVFALFFVYVAIVLIILSLQSSVM